MIYAVVVAGYDLAHWCAAECDRREWLVPALLIVAAVLLGGK